MILKNKFKYFVIFKTMITGISVVAVGSTIFVQTGQAFSVLSQHSINLSTERPELSYMLLPIMNNVNATNNAKEYRQFIFDRIGISEKAWMDQSTNVAQEAKQFLLTTDTLWKTPADPAKIRRFNNDKMGQHFNSLGALEGKINDYLGFTAPKLFSFRRIFGNNTKGKEAKNEFKTFILDFYNFLVGSRIFKEEEVIKLLFNVTGTAPQGMPPETKAETFIEVTDDQATMGIYFNKNKSNKWYDQKDINQEFVTGWSVSRDRFRTFVHEFGHVINLYFALTPEQRQNLNLWHNLDVDGDIEEETEKSQNHLSNREKNRVRSDFGNKEDAFVEQAQDYMVKRLNHGNLQNSSIFQLARLSVVPSEYGRTEQRDPNTQAFPLVSPEWFAEGFAYLYSTSDSQKNKIWEMWYDFFYQQLRTLQSYTII